MSKKKFNKELEFSEPTIVSVDELAYMTEEALRDRSNRLELERNKVSFSGKNPLLWEVELAYVQREQNLRRSRLEFHAEYMKKNVVNNETEDFDSKLDCEKLDKLN